MRLSTSLLTAISITCWLLLLGTASNVAGDAPVRIVPVYGWWEARLLPPLQGGSVGWCVAFEFHGSGSWGCPADPVVGKPIVDEDWGGSSPPPVTDGEALTLSNVRAVSVDGGPPIPTYTRPGLPFGLRAVAVDAPGVFGPGSGLQSSRFTALDEHDNPLPQPRTQRELAWSQSGTRWQRPQRPSHGICSIKASGLQGITARWGQVVTRLKSVKGIIGDGFISCIDTEYYFQKWPFDAAVLLDAEHPLTASPVVIPNLSPVHGHPGIFSAIGGNGKILARRINKAWLVLQGGYTLQQRLTVFQHLHTAIPAR